MNERDRDTQRKTERECIMNYFRIKYLNKKQTKENQINIMCKRKSV